jgi:hypothetical protein
MVMAMRRTTYLARECGGKWAMTRFSAVLPQFDENLGFLNAWPEN